MKRIVPLVFVFMLLLVGAIYAQDDADVVEVDIVGVIIQNFEEGTFEETDDNNIFTLTLVNSNVQDTTQFASVSPKFKVSSLMTLLFNTGLASVENLETLEATLVLESQGISIDLLLTDFVLEDIDTVQFTAEFIEVASLAIEGDAELVDDFDEAELYVYLNSTNLTLIQDSLGNMGLRYPPHPPTGTGGTFP